MPSKSQKFTLDRLLGPGEKWSKEGIYKGNDNVLYSVTAAKVSLKSRAEGWSKTAPGIVPEGPALYDIHITLKNGDHEMIRELDQWKANDIRNQMADSSRNFLEFTCIYKGRDETRFYLKDTIALLKVRFFTIAGADTSGE